MENHSLTDEQTFFIKFASMAYGYCLLAYNIRNAVGGGCAEEDDPD